MRSLSGAVVVLAGAVCVAAEVQTAHLHPDRWGLTVGLPFVVIGLVVWVVGLSARDSRPQPRE